jgi:riboflavin-specific deaminase-like protein
MPRDAKALEGADFDKLEARAWRSLLAAAAGARHGTSPPDLEWLVRLVDAYALAPDAPAPVRALLELYVPLCLVPAGRSLAVGHLGQSLDGFIATASGDSYYVTGPANVRHLHRLRALCSAIVVGAGTIERDDPQLTVRHVEGPNPTRVVLDPSGRLGARRRVFTDGAAPTIVVHADGSRAPAPGSAEIVRVPAERGRLDLGVLLERLRERGLASVFVEGGGSTVSGFLGAGLLDRLHVAIAPLVLGSGRPGITLPARERIADCLRPAHRVFTMGGDVLFDCDLRAAPAAQAAGTFSRAV